MGPGRGTLGESHVFLHASRLLVAALVCLLVAVAAPAYADHKPGHAPGGGQQPDKPGKPGKPGKPDEPGKPGDNYSASLLTTLQLSLQGVTASALDVSGQVVVLVEVLSDAVAGGPLAPAGRVELRDGHEVIATQPVDDGVARFRLPAGSLGADGAELTARFRPADGSHFAPSETAEPLRVGACEDCAEDEVTLASAGQLPAQSDPTMRWMGLAALVLLAGGALLWLMAGGPWRRSARRR